MSRMYEAGVTNGEPAGPSIEKYGASIAGDPLPVRTEVWSECLPGG